MMRKFEWEYLLDRIFQFNRLIHTDEDRKTEFYYNKCCDLIDEEYLNELLPWYGEYQNTGSFASLIQVADGIADTIVVTVQAAEINTPSSLDYRYISALLNSQVCNKHKDIFIRPVIDALNIAYELDIDVPAVVKEVCDSNMSKVPTVGAVAEYYGLPTLDACAAAAEWIESQDESGEVEIAWKIRKDTHDIDRVIFYNQRGKVCKPIFYREPVLNSILESDFHKQ